MEHAGATRVLVVDSNPDDLLLTCRLLAQIEVGRYELECVDNYEEALVAMRGNRHDVCLLDFHLDGGTGTELLQQARAAGCRVPILILTGQSLDEKVLAATAAGAADYLIKGEISAPLLERAIRYARHSLERERRLEETQAQLRLVIDQLPGGVWTTDEQLRYTWGAGPLIERAGLSPQGMVGLPLPDILCTTDPQDLALAAHRAALEGQAARYEGSFAGHPIEAHLRPLRTADNTIIGVVGMALDISGRKRAEEALRQSQARFQTFMDHSPVYAWLKDAEGRYVYGNKLWLQLVGCGLEEALGRTDLELFPPELATRFRENDAAVLLTQQLLHVDESVEIPTEGLRHTVTRKFLLQDENGQPLVGGMALDITPQLQMAEQLQRQLCILEGVIEGTTDAVFVKDCEGRYLLMNTAGASFIQKPVNEVIGRSDAELFPAETAAEILETDRQVLETGKTLTREERLTSAGVSRTYLATKGPLLDQDGQTIGLIGVSRDITERKAAEMALRESEARFRSMAESAPVGIYLADVNSRGIYLNPSLERLLGMNLEESHTRWVESIYPEDRERVFSTWQAAVEAGQAWQSSHRAVHPDGTVRWLDVQAAPVHDAEQLLGYVGMVHDVTEHKQLELAVRESERRFRAIFEEAAIGIALVDLDGRLFQANSALSEMMGFPEGELRQKHFSEITHADDLDLDYALYEDVLAGRRGTCRLEKRYVRKDGRGFWAHLSVSVVRDTEGKPQFFVAMMEDITQRKQAEERNLAFQTLGQRLNEVETPEAAARVVLDIADRLLGWDCCWLDLVVPDERWPRTLVLMDLVDGQRMDVTPPTSLNPAAVPLTQRALREGPLLILRDPEHMPQVGVDVHIPFGEATRLSASIVCVPIRTREREVGALSIQSYTFNAYTEEDLRVLQALADYCAGALERTRVEAAREHLQQQLVQAQKMEAVGNLAGGIAHDFNNMLAVINGYSEMLLGTIRPDSPLRGYLGEINKAGGRAADLTRQLLAFSRKQLLAPKVLDLNDAVRNLDKMLRRLIGEDIELVTLLGTNLGRVKADPGQLEQVIMNLVVNARDAMPQGGRLLLRTRDAEAADTQTAVEVKPGHYVALEVEDTGCGIKPEVLERIFEPFFTTKEQGKGTGLGLATVFGIVKQSGGYIDVTSEPGLGTRFTVYLPQVEESVTTEDFTPQVLPSGRETILLVEDEPMVRRMVRQVLEQCGYAVLEAMQGDDALRLARTHAGPIHLLLTDVVMPRMSGRELAEQFNSLRPEAQVLFMSGYTDDAVMRHGLEAAEMDLLQKPFTHLALAQRIRRVLDRTPPQSSRGHILLIDDDAAQRETLGELLQDAGYQTTSAAEGQQALALLRSVPRVDVILLDLMMPGMNGWIFRLEQQRDPSLADIPVIIMSGQQDPAGAVEFLKPAGCLEKPLEIERLLKMLSQFVDVERPRS